MTALLVADQRAALILVGLSVAVLAWWTLVTRGGRR